MNRNSYIDTVAEARTYLQFEDRSKWIDTYWTPSPGEKNKQGTDVNIMARMDDNSRAGVVRYLDGKWQIGVD